MTTTLERLAARVLIAALSSFLGLAGCERPAAPMDGASDPSSSAASVEEADASDAADDTPSTPPDEVANEAADETGDSTSEAEDDAPDAAEEVADEGAPVGEEGAVETETDTGAVSIVGSPEAIRARQVERFRQAANACFEAYAASEGRDVSKLECFAMQHRQAVELFEDPADCPTCLLDYGRALRFLAYYYGMAQQVAGGEIEEAGDSLPEEEKVELQALIVDARDRRERYFREARDHLERYLRITKTPTPEVYEWLSEANAQLGDWRAAITYLDEFIEAAGILGEDAAKLREVQEIYREQMNASAEGGESPEGDAPADDS